METGQHARLKGITMEFTKPELLLEIKTVTLYKFDTTVSLASENNECIRLHIDQTTIKVSNASKPFVRADTCTIREMPLSIKSAAAVVKISHRLLSLPSIRD